MSSNEQPLRAENARLVAKLQELLVEEEHSTTSSLERVLKLRYARLSLINWHLPVFSNVEFMKVPNTFTWICDAVEMRLHNGWPGHTAAVAASRRQQQAQQQQQQVESGAAVLLDSDEEAAPSTLPRTADGRGRGSGRGRGRGRQRNAQSQQAAVPSARQQQVASGAEVLPDSDEEAAPVAPSRAANGRGRGRRRGQGRGRGRSGAPSRGPAPPYCPQYRSAPYAVLIALLQAELNEGRYELLKAELVPLAQQFANEVILKQGTDDPRSWYCGWSSVNQQLVHKGFVKAWSNPRLYALTYEGRELATKCKTIEESAMGRTVNEYGQDGEMEIEEEPAEPEENVQREEERGLSPDVDKARRHYTGQLIEVREFGQPGDASRVSGVGASGGGGGRMRSGAGDMRRFTEKQVDRSVSVISKLERGGEEREACMEVLQEVFERDSTFPRTEDRLFEEMSSLLWRRRQKEMGARSSGTQIRIGGAYNAERDIGSEVRARALDVSGGRASRSEPTGVEILREVADVLVDSPSRIARSRLEIPRNASLDPISTDFRPSPLILPAKPCPPGLAALGEHSPSKGFSRRSKPTSIANSRSNSGNLAPKAPPAIIEIDDDSDGDGDVLIQDPPRSQAATRSPQKRPRSKTATWNPTARAGGNGPSQLTSERVFSLEDVVHVSDDDTPDALEAQPTLQQEPARDIIDVMEPERTFAQSVPAVADWVRHEDNAQRDATWLRNVSSHDDVIVPEEEEDVVDVMAPEENAVQLSPHADARAGVRCRVLLIVDSMERVRRRSRVTELDTMKQRLLAQGVDCEVRPLPCGDALFVAQYGDTEVVLDYLIERKTLEDFDASLRDGRERRQAFMMRQSQIPRRMFLLEGDMRFHPDLADNARFSTRRATLEMAEDFYVKTTKDLNDTLWFYASLYRRLSAEFEEQPFARTVAGRSLFSDWNKRMKDLGKGMTLEQLFMLQLCQVHGVGKESAMVILQSGCRTPYALFEKLQSVQGVEERERLFAGEDGVNSRAARTLSRLFTATDYGTETV